METKSVRLKLIELACWGRSPRSRRTQPDMMRCFAMMLLPLAAALRVPNPSLRSFGKPAAAAAITTMLTQHPLAATAADLASSQPSTFLLAREFDAVDVYYGVLLLGAVAFFGYNAVKNTVQEAKSYDERGAMVNAMRAEKIKRDRAAALEKTKRNDPAYERLQAEKRMREGRRDQWKAFGDD